jgi:phosphoribosylanthranilate isomerase
VADRVRVKICGLTRREDALAADAAGADLVGVVMSRGFGRSVPPDRARSIVQDLAAVPVAVLVDESADDAATLGRGLEAGVLQLHGNEPPEVVERLAGLGPWKLWKCVRVRRAGDLLEAVERYGALVDGILLEGHRDGVIGGGGVRIDLDAVGEVRPRIPARLEVVLAGGLTPDNVADAVARFAPDVVDVSSGVERGPGLKDPDLIRLFIENARRGHDRLRRPSAPDPERADP